MYGEIFIMMLNNTHGHIHENVLSMARLDRFYVFKHHLSYFVNGSILPVGFSEVWLCVE